MMHHRKLTSAAAVSLVTAVLLVASPTSPVLADTCGDLDSIRLQVLGSGGPIADDARASSAYLVWIDGQSRVLVDAGGGAFVRFGEAGAKFSELDIIAISHFHTDHSADLITLLKTGFFSARERPLVVSGPGAGGPFPSLNDFLNHNLGKGNAYGYLSGYLDGSGGLVKLLPLTIDPTSRDAVDVFASADGEIELTGTGVPHGIVPAIGYRVAVGGKEIVFASDQNGNDDEFIGFARDADVLVMHMVVPEDATGAMRALHVPPSRIGEIAAAANVRKLVLSHFMARSLQNLDQNIELVRQHFDGAVIVANDLMCIEVD
jgi:ribonuclease BN (tRNA processing enzyme)